MKSIQQLMSQAAARSATPLPAEKPSKPLSTQASESVPDEIAPGTESWVGVKVSGGRKKQKPIFPEKGYFQIEKDQKTQQIFLSLQSEILDSVIFPKKDETLDFFSRVSDRLGADRDQSEKPLLLSQSEETIENWDDELEELKNVTNKFDFVKILDRIAKKENNPLTYEQVQLIQKSPSLDRRFLTKIIGRIWS